MKKIKILKTSYWRTKIKNLILKTCLLDFRLKKNIENKDEKILIVTLGSLGDNLIETRVIEILAEKFSKKNIYILCKNNWKIIYTLQGYFNVFVDERNWNIFYKIKLYRKLNYMNFKKIIVLNHGNVPIKLEYIYSKNIYSSYGNREYILENQLDLLKKILNKNFHLEDIKPDIRKYFIVNKNKSICIGIGASGNERIMKIETMRDIIFNLLLKFPDKEIILLGNGKREKEYVEKLMEKIVNKKVKNAIDKYTLLETLQHIYSCELFIGMDSGLMNAAIALNKKVICTHWSKEKYSWEAPFSNVKTIKGIGGKKYIDKKYGNEILNSIKFTQIEQAMKELKFL